MQSHLAASRRPSLGDRFHVGLGRLITTVTTRVAEVMHLRIALLPQKSISTSRLDGMRLMHHLAVSSQPAISAIHIHVSRISIDRNNLFIHISIVALFATLSETVLAIRNLRSYTLTFLFAAHNIRPPTLPEHKSRPSLQPIKSILQLRIHEGVSQSKGSSIKTRLTIYFRLQRPTETTSRKMRNSA